MRKLLFATILLTAPALVLAQNFGSMGRAQSWEFSIGGIYQEGDSASGEGGSSLNVDGELGIAFNVGYNFNDRFALSADFDFVKPDYQAVLVDENNPLNTTTINHSWSQFNGRLKGTFNFMDGPFSPYVEGGVGWTYIDSNVVDGPPITGCWWHPWWGYICSNFYNTFSSTEFSYGVGLGLRYDLAGGSFIKGSYSLWKLDTGGSAADPELKSWRLEYGWRF